MKKLKIRYIEYTKNNRISFSMERKTWFGWKSIGYTTNFGYGYVYDLYESENKEELLSEVLEKFYKTTKKFCIIIEYPKIKFY